VIETTSTTPLVLPAEISTGVGAEPSGSQLMDHAVATPAVVAGGEGTTARKETTTELANGLISRWLIPESPLINVMGVDQTPDDGDRHDPRSEVRVASVHTTEATESSPYDVSTVGEFRVPEDVAMYEKSDHGAPEPLDKAAPMRIPVSVRSTIAISLAPLGMVVISVSRTSCSGSTRFATDPRSPIEVGSITEILVDISVPEAAAVGSHEVDATQPMRSVRRPRIRPDE
jgi:hypothetical protein